MQEWRLDHDYKRFALLVAVPFLACVSLVSRLHQLPENSLTVVVQFSSSPYKL